MRVYTLFILFVVVLLSGCLKQTDQEPCPLIEPIMSYKVISVIDKDSNNLLLNGSIDTLDIVLKDKQGKPQKVIPLLDSTLTKTRYLLLMLSDKEGSHQLNIHIENKHHIFSYDLKIIHGKCFSDYQYKNYMINENPYQFKSAWDYLMFGGGLSHKMNTHIELLFIVQE